MPDARETQTFSPPNQPIPAPTRPRFPEGYGVPTGAEGLLPWSHVTERLVRARNVWVSTVQRDGMPHAVPVWSVWVEDTLYFHVAPTSRTGSNLAANPAVAIHLESGDDVVILKGYVELINNRLLGVERAARVAAASRQKYPEAFENAAPWEYDPDDGGAFAVRLTTVYAWTNLAVDPTRWEFTSA